MTRVTLVVSSLGAGGAERVMSTMANYWADRGCAITLLTQDKGRVPPHYDLNPAITHCSIGGIAPNRLGLTVRAALNSKRRLGTVLDWPGSKVRWARRLLRLREAIRNSQPDVVISFVDQINVVVLLATRSLGLPVIVSERTDPHQWSMGSKMLEWLRRILYFKATYVVVQTERAMSYFSPKVQSKTRIIPNPVVLPEGRASRGKRRGDTGGRVLIAVGRLSEEKGFDLLLQAFAPIAGEHPAWRLEIWGEGHLRPDLERMVPELGLCGRVRFAGLTKHPYEKLSQADLFVLSSRFEGFPNTLCEAMACGLPVVSFDCPSGPGEIIRNGIDGVLVPPGNVIKLSETLDRLMRDEVERKRLAAAAPEVAERFGVQKVMGLWEELVRSCV